MSVVSELMQWTKVELEGPPPANRLDFACCTLKLHIPVISNNLSKSAFIVEDPNSKATVESDDARLKIVSSDEQYSDTRKATANIVDLNFEDSLKGNAGDFSRFVIKFPIYILKSSVDWMVQYQRGSILLLPNL